MKFSCCCGLITGFILALLCAGGVYYYFYCKENPEASAAVRQTAESSWEATKAAGDSSWEATKAAGDKVFSTAKPEKSHGIVLPEATTPAEVQAKKLIKLPPPQKLPAD